ncbi:branched-chain amino acid ABC transporter substrate-binding protein [Streptomyces sp. NPDC006638]|uniref:branched-chain amino acid ABC transporter substrate-binding protein n=1 Tax=Streptomyces sp. NPDC006638 TaxID=3157183 RepID=UPI0033BB4D9A
MVRIEWPLHIVRRVVLAAVAAAVLAVGGWFAVSWLEDSRARCGDGVVKRGEDKECVGVTDGAYVFRGHLTQVEKAIEKENDRIENSGEPYVSVAYMTSLTLDGTDSNSDESVRHELQGAYLAQYRHNRGDLAASPKIRLLIANTGGGSDHWRYTVGELVKRKSTDDRLVAVTGLGPSTDENRAAVDLLSTRGIAMVASTMTATSIKDIHNFVRVSPTNADEAYAAAAYLKRKKFRTAVVVQDAAKGNLYATTLGSEFTRAFPDFATGHRLVAEKMTYDSSVANAWESEMNFMSSQLCDEEPEVIYFAGRGTHLMRFLGALSNRACQDVEFTVIAGDDTTNLTREQLAAAAKTQVEVLYTGLAHPDMYRTDPKAVSAPSARYFAEGGFLDTTFPNNSREDGQAIMAHDAVLTAARGIQMAAGQGKVTVTGDAVARMFHQMNGGQQVAGASGFLSFQNNGNPRDKAVPILRLTATGRAEFVEVSAARGRPREGGEGR